MQHARGIFIFLPTLYPTPWQKKMLWNAITSLSLLVIAGIVVFTLYVTTQILAFLQPLLLPVAIAGVIAYLLEPVVSWLARRKMPRLLAVVLVFGAFVLGGVLLFVGVIPSVYTESVKFSSALPSYLVRGWDTINGFLEQNLEMIPQIGGTPPPEPSATPTPTPPSASNTTKERLERYQTNPYVQQSLQYLQDQLPTLVQRTWTFVQTSLTGVFGVFGFMVGLLIVPIYLFFFLKESPRIARTWSNYLPLRRSEFKDEVVAVLTEINGYLINFFRGQLVVAFINGVLLAIGLSVLGLQFGFLIGLGFAFFGIIPYVGYIVCYIPSVLIAFAQFNDWVHPLWVTIIFFLIIAQIDGLVTTPRIVGNSVGLHPMTVIMSVFLWTLVLGGLLGAILAIPLTATLKVLLHRYVWDRQRNIFFQDDIPTKDEIEIAT
ncbi:MAG TPA: AI-2E family transporter [Chthoniobacterales bacterium]|nr:AI-2E family transporter [Chthoniobacterales bacterium]